MKQAFLQFAQVTKRLGKNLAVDKASFEIPEGEVLALFGPSGCGKTTILRLVAGLEYPDAGRIVLDGLGVAENGSSVVPPHRRNVGFVFQDLALWPHMKVSENLDFVLASTGLPKKERRERVLQMLSLTRVERYAGNYPSQLSGGEQQRVALARALVSHPRLLLLDEPMSSLDAELKTELLAELKHLQQRLGVTTIHVTHDRAEAEALAHRIAVMRHGQIVRFEANRALAEAGSRAKPD